MWKFGKKDGQVIDRQIADLLESRLLPHTRARPDQQEAERIARSAVALVRE
jgi:hypothetical protein